MVYYENKNCRVKIGVSVRGWHVEKEQVEKNEVHMLKKI